MAQNVNPSSSRVHEAAEKESNSRYPGLARLPGLHSGAQTARGVEVHH